MPFISRHPVVGEDHRDRVAAQLELAQRVERLPAGLGAHDPVVLAVPAAQVAGDGAGHGRVVVDGHEDGPTLRHGTSLLPDDSGAPSVTAQGPTLLPAIMAIGALLSGPGRPPADRVPPWACRSPRAS